MSTIKVHARHAGVRTLGPGSRFALWVQGCDRDCPGCVSSGSHDPAGGEEMSARSLAAEILASRPDGITVSGGEPFLQAAALAELIGLVREREDLGVICYTGRTYEELRERDAARPLLEVIDLLIDGPYVQELDDGLPLRGSSNQRFVHLSERYAGIERAYEGRERDCEAFWIPGGIGVAGIPSHGARQRETC